MPPPKQTSRAPAGRAARLAGQPYTRCTNILLFFVHYFSRCSSQKYAILEKENPVEFLLPRLCAAPRTGPCRAVQRKGHAQKAQRRPPCRKINSPACWRCSGSFCAATPLTKRPRRPSTASAPRASSATWKRCAAGSARRATTLSTTAKPTPTACWQPEEARLTKSEVLAVCKILLESRAFTEAELDPILNKLVACCTPAQNLKAVQELIGNERFHYVPPHHGQKFVDKLWALGEAIRGPPRAGDGLHRPRRRAQAPPRAAGGHFVQRVLFLSGGVH